MRPKTYVGQLLILGNGFDRQCGLESSYADFYNDRYPSDVIDKILKIGTDYDISSVGSIYRFNIWDYILVYYFKFKSNESPYEQWSSIEDIIEMVVDDQLSQKIFRRHDDLHPFNLFSDLRARIMATDDLSEDDIGTFVEKHPSVSNKHSESNYLYFLEHLSCILKNNYPDIIYQLNQNDDSNYSIRKMFLSELKKFESAFACYLVEELKKAPEDKDNYFAKSRDLIEQLIGTDLQLDDNDQLANSILSFNYTKPFSWYRATAETIYCLRNVHGALNKEKPAESEIIFGIDSQDINHISETANKTNNAEGRTGFTKTFRTLSLNASRLEHNIFDYEIQIIKVYGHSLDEGDYSYFQSIFDAVDLYGSNVAIYFYYSAYADSDHANDELEYDYFKKVAHLFEEYGSTIDNPNHGKNLLHKLILEDRIHIKKIDSNILDQNWFDYRDRVVEEHI
ncbi:AbiH family protein [Oenococcus oeni]|uniref:AbiH family protein n=1 Tax=Oenococcus oeni TaxID=1247 RepID=UPI00178C1BAB|nr:AbiH family protein [Oenococcus oeni]